MKHNGSLIAKHFISPLSHGADELDSSYAIVGHQYLLYGTFATIPVNKLLWCSDLLKRMGKKGRGEGEERKGGGERERERERGGGIETG